MCGRFTLSQSGEILADTFDLDMVPDIAPRYNIAPSQPVAVVLCPAARPLRHYRLLRWGLIPSWAKDSTIGHRLINARAETITEKPSFRAAFKRRRCLILADGFYEWQRQANRKTKQPHYIFLRGHRPFAFAGLWEHWSDPSSGSELETCTIITTEPNDVIAPIHNRMPVILRPEDHATWLDPAYGHPGELQAMLCPYDAAAMDCYAVSPAVNNPHHDSPACIQPVAPE